MKLSHGPVQPIATIGIEQAVEETGIWEWPLQFLWKVWHSCRARRSLHFYTEEGWD
jgi:hypothetical protein